MQESAIDYERLRHEAERVYLRYAREAVEGLGFCPWAQAAREQGRTQLRVVFGREPQLTAALAAVTEIAEQPQIDIGLLIFPELELDRLPFAHFVAELRAADAAQRPIGEAALAMADFHPNARADQSTPERLVPFVRSAPDPTIQLVRRSALDAVRMTDTQGTSFIEPSRLSLAQLVAAQTPAPLATRIARQNARTVERLGAEHVAATFCEIVRDRDASYAALGLPPRSWAKVGG